VFTSVDFVTSATWRGRGTVLTAVRFFAYWSVSTAGYLEKLWVVFMKFVELADYGPEKS